MYNLPYHKENDEQVVHEFIQQYPFAFLTGCDAANRPVATQVPLFLEKEGERTLLKGHLMRHTDHHRAFAHHAQVLAVFTGKHSYVSGTWYSNPHTPSTWNYMSVHARGTIRFLEGGELEEMLRKTSLHFEGNNPHSATVFDNLPAEYTKRIMSAIVAFEIEITEMDNVFKLSQDRDAASYQNIIAKLKEKDDDGQAIAAEMEKRMKALFPDEG
jgi:transcriptional regulator